MIQPHIVWVIAIICIVLVFVSISHPDIKSPAKWLTDWTMWIGQVVTIVVAARVFWLGAEYLATLI